LVPNTNPIKPKHIKNPIPRIFIPMHYPEIWSSPRFYDNLLAWRAYGAKRLFVTLLD